MRQRPADLRTDGMMEGGVQLPSPVRRRPPKKQDPLWKHFLPLIVVAIIGAAAAYGIYSNTLDIAASILAKGASDEHLKVNTGSSARVPSHPTLDEGHR